MLPKFGDLFQSHRTHIFALITPIERNFSHDSKGLDRTINGRHGVSPDLRILHYILFSSYAEGHETWGCYRRLPLISKDRGRAHTSVALYLGFVCLDSFMTKSIKLFCYAKCRAKSNMHSNGEKTRLFVLRKYARVNYLKLESMRFDVHVVKNYFTGARTSQPPRGSAQPVIRHRYECHTRIRKRSASLFVISTLVWWVSVVQFNNFLYLVS